MVPDASRVTTMIKQTRGWRMHVLVAHFPPAAPGHITPRFPATYDPIRRADSYHAVYSVAGGEAEANC